MSSKGVVFKCSFGGSDGWGHVIRSSAVGNAFQKAGWQTTLWSKSDTALLPAEVRSAFDNAVSDFFTSNAKEHSSVLFVDEMYTSDAEFNELASRWRNLSGPRFLVGVDDMQQRSMTAFDLVINTEIGLQQASYAAQATLLGEQYAMLRSGFSRPLNVENKILDTELIPVFVMLGGTDAYNYTPRVLSELRRWNDKVVPVVVYSSTGEKQREVLEVLSCFSDHRLLENANSSELAAWMQACRFGVIACGTSLYEAAAMQMPFVGISLVDNQKATAEKVESSWGMPVVQREGRHDDMFEIANELRAVSVMPIQSYSQTTLGGCHEIMNTVMRLFF